MPTLHLTIGLPCSGKTTRAKQLEADHNALRFTPDEWHLRLFGDDVGDPRHDERHTAVEGIMWDVASSALLRGVNVVIDFGLWSLEERDEFRARAKSLGCDCVLHVCDVPEDELYRRLRERNAAELPGVFVIPDEEMTKYIKVYQAPMEDEPLCVFASGGFLGKR